jgi:glycosyltransferase involved in cell wall biosynthesis
VIALLHGLRAFGAVERYLEAIVEGLRDRGEDLVLVHLDDPAVEPLARLAGGRVRTVALRPAPAAVLAARLHRLLRRGRPRLAHVIDVWPPALIAARAACVPRVLVTHHTPELPRRENLHGRLWWRAGWATRPEVIYTSEADRRRDGRSPSHVVALGIELERFAAASPALALDGRIVGTVGRLAAQKGQRYLVDAAPAVLARHPDARFVIVGDGELRGELERLAADRGIADRILFTGPREDIPELLASFELFACPSLFEGLCLAVIEAQAAGVPVVATPVGGIRETVEDGVTGFLVTPADSASLAERIVFCLEHPGEARRAAEEARRRVVRFSRERMVEETLALYDRSR